MAKQIRYSEEFKQQAVSMYLQGKLSCNQIAQSIHVHPNTLSLWVGKYKNSQLPSASPPPANKCIPPLTANLEMSAIFLALSEIEAQTKILKKLIIGYQ